MSIRFNAEGYVPEYGPGVPDTTPEPQIDPVYISRALVERAYFPEYESKPIFYPDLPEHRRKSASPVEPQKPKLRIVRAAEIPAEDARALLLTLAEATRTVRRKLRGKSLRRANQYVWECLDEMTQLKRELTGLKAVRL